MCAAAPPADAATALWPTYHRTTRHDGVDASSPPARRIRPAWRTARLDGQLFASPLVVGDVVYVATQANSIYALRAGSGRVLWRRNLGAPVQRRRLPCGNIEPTTGITSTPVIDPARRILYAVAFRAGFVHELVAVSLDGGRVLWRRPVDPPMDPARFEQQRAGLLLAYGRVYIGYGALRGDCVPYHGWLVGAPADNRGPNVHVRPASESGGIWAASGPVTGDHGDVLVAVGQGRSQEAYDGANSVISLTPDLRTRSFFAPADWKRLNRLDLDQGTTGPAPVGRRTAFAIGKAGVGYLLSTANLGGIGGQRFARRVCASAYGGTAFRAPYVYVPCSDGLLALRLNAARSGFTRAWKGVDDFAAPPIVAGGLVWSLSQGQRRLYAYDARTGKVRFRAPISGKSISFVTPAAGDGRVFMGAGDRLAAFSWR